MLAAELKTSTPSKQPLRGQVVSRPFGGPSAGLDSFFNGFMMWDSSLDLTDNMPQPYNKCGGCMPEHQSQHDSPEFAEYVLAHFM